MNSQPPLLLSNSKMMPIWLSEADAAALYVAVSEAPLAIRKHVEYLQDKLRGIMEECRGHYNGSILNSAEDQVLRHWYMTRGMTRPLTQDSWTTLSQECFRRYGTDLETVDRAKVCKFANSTVEVTHRYHAAREPKAPTEPKRPATRAMTKEQAMKALEELFKS